MTGGGIDIRDYFPGVIGAITALHARYYHAHWDFGAYFESRVAADMAAFVRRFDAERDLFRVAVARERGGERIVGSVALDGSRAGDEGAHLRWFIVEPGHAGGGLGARLLRQALDFADRKGYPRVFLWTFAGLDAARHLYEKAGFRLVHEAWDAQWGKRVLEQRFERLRPT